MKQLALTTCCIGIAVIFLMPDALAQQQDEEIEGERLAQTGMKFLSVSVDARAAAVGDAVTAMEGSSASMFYNPAGMARMDKFADVALGYTQWIGNYRYNTASIALHPSGGRYGVFGLSVRAADYGDFLETIRADNQQGFEDLGTFSPSATSVGLGYARLLTDRFAIGANVKYARQSLGSSTMGLSAGGSPEKQDFSEGTIAVDFGTIYRTGFRSLNFAFSARNFAREITYAEESFELPLTFRVGISMNMLDFTTFNTDAHSFLLSVEGERPRDYAEQIKVGGEYLFRNMLALRAGYAYPADEKGISLGAGLQQELGDLRFHFDYAYTQFGVFGNVNRFGFKLAF